MATNNFIGDFSDAAHSEWNTDTNWSLGHVPTSTEDTTFTGITTEGVSLTVTTTAVDVKSIDFSTAGATFTFSGSKNITSRGNLTLKTGMSWTSTGSLRCGYGAAGVLTSNGVSLSTITQLTLSYNGSSLTLADALNLGTTAGLFYMYNNVTFNSGGFDVTCRILSDSGSTGAVTLTLGSSTINCTNVSFAAATVTMTSQDHTINIANSAGTDAYFSNISWGIVNLTLTGTGTIQISNGAGGSPSFRQLNITQNVDADRGVAFLSTAFSIAESSSWLGGGVGNDNARYRVIVTGGGTTVTYSAASKTHTMTDIDLVSLTIAATNSPTVTSTRVGDLGNNSASCNVSAPKTVYAFGGTTNSVSYGSNVWTTVDTANGADRDATDISLVNFPLPQDTAVIDNFTWSDTGNTFTLDYVRCGKVDASALTEAQNINPFGYSYRCNSLILNGPGVTITGSGGVLTFSYNTVSTIDVNFPTSTSTGSMIQNTTATVRLLAALTFAGTYTLTKGTLNLNGQTLTTILYSSNNTNVRELQFHGGNITVTGTTGTIFNQTTATNLTYHDAGDVTLNGALTAAIAIAGGGKTFNNFWNNTTNALGCNVLDSNTFNDFKINAGRTQTFTKTTTQTVTSFTADGAVGNLITLDTADGAGTFALHKHGATPVTATYCDIHRSVVDGEAAWNAGTGCVNGGSNTGWTWLGGGGSLVGGRLVSGQLVGGRLIR